ncbi:hypothetical protein ACROYT_G030203 [Oculina patagonica]
MSIALVWLLCCTTASQKTSRDHLETCHQNSDSAADKIYESSNLPDDKSKTHICGALNGADKGEHKYQMHNNGDPRFRGVYSFPVDPIPRRNCFDEEAMQFLQQGLPVVLDNCTFHSSTLKWTIEYLAENLQDEDHTAYISQTRKFLYYDGDLIKGAYKDFKPPTTKQLLYFSNFTTLMKELEKANNGSRAYFQSLLYLQEGVSSSMLEDIDSFNYTWLLDLVRRMDWGEELTNMLLVGMPDVVTPTHFDILENLYVQIFGRKRVILFSPDYFRSLYPYPVGHPHDRQTQLDFENPDLNRFPRFSEIRGMEVALEPGEVLYIPNFWWHYIESEMHSNTISVNFWFEPKNSSKNDDVKNPEKTNDTSIETEKGNSASHEDGKSQEDNKSPVDSRQTTLEDLQESSNSEQASEINDDIKEDEIKSDINKEKENGELEGEDDTEDEQDDTEVELTAAQYLALLRETEINLYRATLSHEKVKKMLDELLSRRFDFL